MKAKKRPEELVGEICLYGTRAIGHGYLARGKGTELLGSGEPKVGRGATEAIWLAAEELRAAGTPKGKVRIFAPGGEMYAEASLYGKIGYYGDLEWKPAAPAATAHYEECRILVLEAEGMTTSDAQGVLDAELMGKGEQS